MNEDASPSTERLDSLLPLSQVSAERGVGYFLDFSFEKTRGNSFLLSSDFLPHPDSLVSPVDPLLFLKPGQQNGVDDDFCPNQDQIKGLMNALDYIQKKYQQAQIEFNFYPNKKDLIFLIQDLTAREKLLDYSQFYFKDQLVDSWVLPFDVYIKPKTERELKEIIFFPPCNHPLVTGSLKERYFGIHLSTGEVIAKLVIKKDFDEDKLLREVKYLEKLQGEGIADQMVYFKSPEGHGILLQKNYEDDLFRHLSQVSMSDDEKFIVFYDLVLGVSKLHSHLLIHRDLKPENILIYKKDLHFHAVVTDLEYLYSLMRRSDNEGMLDLSGTIEFFSPEVMRGKRNNLSLSSDVWAVGIILLELYGHSPLNRGNREQRHKLLKQIKNIQFFSEIDQLFKLHCDDFMRLFYPLRPMEDRFQTLDELVCGMLHPYFFKRVDIQSVLESLKKMAKENRFSMTSHSFVPL